MSQSAPYSNITYLAARKALALRLNDPNNSFWLDPELGLYIKEALRFYNCLTQVFVQDWTVTLGPPPLGSTRAFVWQSTGNTANPLVGINSDSPRLQTLTSNDVFTLAEYHLLEPPTGGTWTGTPQFAIADLVQALQRRQAQVLQATACNVGPFSSTFTLPAGTSRVYLPDSAQQSVLDIRRVRFVPEIGLGAPSTLYREDGLAFEYFEPLFPQTDQNPNAWDVLAGPPLALTFDAYANVPNTLDILAILSGVPIAGATPLLVPDDWFWVLKYGMMADLLRKESESTDLARAEYCEKRFQEGVKLMLEMPWVLQGRINNVAVDTPSVAEMDMFSYEWQSNPNADPMIVIGGIDLFAVSPPLPANTNVAVTLSLVGNAPVPVADDDPVQVSADVLDTILDYAQHLAAFKEGGAEFSQTMPLYQNFVALAEQQNSRLRESGIFATTLRPPDSRQDHLQPRYAAKE